MTWAWLILGWVIVAVIVAPLLGRDDIEFDEDWP